MSNDHTFGVYKCDECNERFYTKIARRNHKN